MGTSGNRDCQCASENSYSNSIRMGYDRMEQIRGRVRGVLLGRGTVTVHPVATVLFK